MSFSLVVGRPSLAPLEDYMPYLQRIWDTGIMTHNGPLLQQLERELEAYLRVKHVVCVANGTCALQLALRALGIRGEVITTPFSFIATANIIDWERCRPVFVDIDPCTWNLNPQKIEERITDKTTAILPVHVFSAPCDVSAIQQIADRYDLKVIYDAAHAMAVNVSEQSLLRHGNISAVSFHATKLFNTGEGGACITEDNELAERIRRFRFFGFDTQKQVVDGGMNAKMTELSASLGLANLAYLDSVRQRRREKYEFARTLLETVPYITFQQYHPEEYNYSYFPVLFEQESLLLQAIDRMTADNILPRRYFYPSLHMIERFQTQSALPVSERIARHILCLPLHEAFSLQEIKRICRHVTRL